MDNGAQRQKNQADPLPSQPRWSEDALVSDAAFAALHAQAQERIEQGRDGSDIGSDPS